MLRRASLLAWRQRSAQSTHWANAAAAGAAAGAGLLLALHAAPPSTAQAAFMSENQTLGVRHRVGITAWALRDPRAQPGLDETAKSLRTYEQMLGWIKGAGVCDFGSLFGSLLARLLLTFEGQATTAPSSQWTTSVPR